MNTINWTTPPPAKRTGGGHKVWRPSVVEGLKANPGAWALVEQGVTPSRLALWKRLGCEATSRVVSKAPDGSPHADIYARWPESNEQKETGQ